MILVVVEHDGAAPDRLSLEALTLGRTLAASSGVPLHAVAWGPGAAAVAPALASAGVAVLHTIDHPGLTDYAPEAIGKALGQLVERDAPAAVIGTGSDRGAEVMAHLAARRGLALAANCTEVRIGDPWQVTRQRWGGSLLEEARLAGPDAAADRRAARRRTRRGGRSRDDRRPAVRAGPRRARLPGPDHLARPGGGGGRSRWRTPGWWSVAGAASAAPRASPSSTSSPRCWAERSASRGS